MPIFDISESPGKPITGGSNSRRRASRESYTRFDGWVGPRTRKSHQQMLAPYALRLAQNGKHWLGNDQAWPEVHQLRPEFCQVWAKLGLNIVEQHSASVVCCRCSIMLGVVSVEWVWRRYVCGVSSFKHYTIGECPPPPVAHVSVPGVPLRTLMSSPKM